MKKSEELKKKLGYEKSNFWKTATKKEQRVALKFADDYIQFLNRCKTVRETVDHISTELGKRGFSPIDSSDDNKRVWTQAHGKVLGFALLGEKPVSEGVNIIAAHIDSPRIDLKRSPLAEESNSETAILKTHYYGGIKKYQWMSTPLALHGVIITAEGKRIVVSIGEDEKDPVLMIPDLLPHLSHKIQSGKKVTEMITPEQMQVIAGTIPYTEKDEKVPNAMKLKILELLHEQYGITEEDFLSAELELVPAMKARECGLDRSMVTGYGQDDRICAYTAMQALFDADTVKRTSVVLLFDKEEVGSDGNTGADSVFFTDFIADLLHRAGEPSDSYNLRKTLLKSRVLSADVNAAVNPNFPSVHEKQNAVILGCGVSLTKYTGSRGKYGTNDANAEFMADVMRIFNEEKVNWQIGDLGKVDEGGGGTIAKLLSRIGPEVIDCGTGLLGMHSLYEICSKADIYSTYRAYKAFFVKG